MHIKYTLHIMCVWRNSAAITPVTSSHPPTARVPGTHPPQNNSPATLPRPLLAILAATPGPVISQKSPVWRTGMSIFRAAAVFPLAAPPCRVFFGRFCNGLPILQGSPRCAAGRAHDRPCSGSITSYGPALRKSAGVRKWCVIAGGAIDCCVINGPWIRTASITQTWFCVSGA
jgi:hypothetical protein